jgi:hypothetical protein
MIIKKEGKTSVSPSVPSPSVLFSLPDLSFWIMHKCLFKKKKFKLINNNNTHTNKRKTPLSKIEEGEIEKINREEEELKRLEKEEDNKFPCCFEGFMRHKCLLCWCF